jgi:hypothetical protein
MDSKGNNRAHWNLFTWSSKPNLSTKNFKRGKNPNNNIFHGSIFSTFFFALFNFSFQFNILSSEYNLESIFHHLCLN